MHLFYETASVKRWLVNLAISLNIICWMRLGKKRYDFISYFKN